ncbi:MAG: phosphate signaling complex protein PhoU [Methanocellales archaeon]|nr:phosphate signaling complex protein PhoU [Methanocellales archaeon]
MIRKTYHQELGGLKQDILKMGDVAKKAIHDSVQSLAEQDKELAAKVIEEYGPMVDKMELEIEDKCMKLIALQQPMAGDLRVIGTCMKMITDLDRMSDLATNIAEITLATADKPLVKPLIDIPRMSELTLEMVKDSLDAFATHDAKLAESVSDKDDIVDALYDQVRRELITLMIEDPHTIGGASHLSFTASHIERMADHACNIAGRVVYMVTGERVKLG